MSRGEMILIMETYLRQLWDDRHWSAALKADNPGEQYGKIKKDIEETKQSDEAREKMSPEEKAWYNS